MNEAKIFDQIVVDEPQNVEIAIYKLTGKKVAFELIKKFIQNEKNTVFYLDRKMNSATEAGNYGDFIWLDTGFRDEKNMPIMICLNKAFSGFTGHYTGQVKDLYKRIKMNNKKNSKDLDRNFSRFLEKYKCKSSERVTAFIEEPSQYAIASANYDMVNCQDTGMAYAMKAAGIEIHNVCEEIIEEVTEEASEAVDEFTKEQNEITVSLLFDQMESMQKYIDELLLRIENHEKTSNEEIARLKEQNQKYKKALVDIRLFNAENSAESNGKKENSEEEKALGHTLLGKNEKILILGSTDIRVAEMRAIARNDYGFEKTDFEFMTDYNKIKAAGSRIHGSNRYAAVIFGNCPHKVAGIGNYGSIIEEFKQRQDCPISIDARTEAGGLKITKQSFRDALVKVCMELKNLQVA